MCSYLPNITELHHNKVYLTELMPHTERGLHLKRRLSFCLLQQLIKNGETARSPENLVVRIFIHRQMNLYWDYNSVLVMLHKCKQLKADNISEPKYMRIERCSI